MSNRVETFRLENLRGYFFCSPGMLDHLRIFSLLARLTINCPDLSGLLLLRFLAQACSDSELTFSGLLNMAASWTASCSVFTASLGTKSTSFKSWAMISTVTFIPALSRLRELLTWLVT